MVKGKFKINERKMDISYCYRKCKQVKEH